MNNEENKSSNNRLRKQAQQLFDHAGITFNGDNDWDIQVHNTDFYKRLLMGGSVGLGESYIDGWWDCKALDEMFVKILQVASNTASLT